MAKRKKPDRELTALETMRRDLNALQASHDIKSENLEIVRKERDALREKLSNLSAARDELLAECRRLEKELDIAKRTFYQPDGSPLVFDTLEAAVKHRAGVGRAVRDSQRWEDRAKWLLSILREPNRPWDALVNWVETNKPDEDGWQYSAAVKKESTR